MLHDSSELPPSMQPDHEGASLPHQDADRAGGASPRPAFSLPARRHIPTTPTTADLPTQQMPALSPLADLPTQHMLASSAPALYPALPQSQMPAAQRSAAVLQALDPSFRKEVERYAQWLQSNNQITTLPETIQAYQDAALEVKTVKKREIRTFAPFQAQSSAFQVITRAQIWFLLALLLAWGVGLYFLHLAIVTYTLGAISALYIFSFIVSTIFATNSFKGPSGETIDEDVIRALDILEVAWPSYTILCPLFKETEVVPQFVEAMQALDYPADKLQVLFLTEESDKETRAALYSMQFPDHFTVLTVPKGSPQTKPRACNFGLLQARGQFVVIFDAEDKPEPLQLKKAVLTFANYGANVACVQAKLNFYNIRQNVLTRLFTAEYSTWFDVMLPGLQHSTFALPLGGTSNHFRTEVLRALGGWDAFNVTEDCDLGLRIARYGLKTAVLDSTTYEEATGRVKVWLFQRSRWIKGYFQTYLVHMRNPWKTLRQGHFRPFFSLQLIVGAWTVVLLINPLMWLSTLIYLVFRPVQLYTILFPGPVMYMGAFCLFLGNFFYIYTHALGCLRRQEYNLLKWIFLLPLYWVMMSISAYIAFYQLIVKPHYWAKTQHGHSLAAQAKTQLRVARGEGFEERSVMSSMPTRRVLAIRFARNGGVLAPTTQRVKALRKNLTGQLQEPPVSRRKLNPLLRDGWLISAFLIGLIASISANVYTFQHHLTLIYSDSYTHLFIARSIFDSITPGLGQLGGSWLPLPHLLIALFVWNDTLWTTGLAGTIVGSLCYLVTIVFVYLAAHRLTQSRFAGFVGALVFLLNPNVLYLQSTPLTEPVCWATFTMACYFTLAWMQENQSRYLILAAGSTCLATLTRYDGWVLMGLIPGVIILTDLIKRRSLRQIEGHLVAFLLLGGLGIALWLAWSQVIFHDPLYFIRGSFSSHAQTTVGGQGAVNSHIAHHLFEDVRIYLIDGIETIGVGLAILALLAFNFYLLRKWRSTDALGMLIFLAPFAFYIAALYGGQVNLLVNNPTFYPFGVIPAAESSNLFNARFGSEIVAPLAILVATLVPAIVKPKAEILVYLRWIWCYFWRAILLVLVIAQAGWVAYSGVISVISNDNPPFCVQSYPIDAYLVQHYNGGRILHVKFPQIFSESETAIHLNNVIYEGSGKLWDEALKTPQVVADWVLFATGDHVAKAMAQDTSFAQNYTLVASGPTVSSADGPTTLKLYHKNGLPPLPTRPISTYLLNEQQFCSSHNYTNGVIQP